MPTVVNCPTCGCPVQWTPDSRFRPFCSERCRLLDLGEWFAEGHRIADSSDVPSDDPPPSQDTSLPH